MTRKQFVLIALVIVAFLGLTWYANSTPKTEKSPIQTSIDSLRESREQQAKIENEISKSVWEKCYQESLTLSGKVFDDQQGIAYKCWTTEKNKIIHGTGNLTPVSEVPIRGIITKVSAAELVTVPRVDKKDTKQVKSERQSPSVYPKSTPAQTVAKSSGIHSFSGKNTTGSIFEKIQNLGYRQYPTIALITACKQAKDPTHCKLYGLSIMYNEAGNQQNSKACITRYNCMGLKSGKMVFKSYQDGMDDWVRRYNRYWYKATSMSQFYAPKGKTSYYGYCTSEDSSNSLVGCPKGLQITSEKFAQLSLIFKK